MALVTRCSNPGCLTLFRVTPAQLQAFGGQVRCGSCNTVFDAFPALTTVADSALKASGEAPAPVADHAAQGESHVSRPTDAAAGRAAGPAVDQETEARDTPEFGAGERVSEWTTAAAQPMVEAQAALQPMSIDRVPDLPPAGSLDFVVAPAVMRAGEDASDPASAPGSATLPPPPLADVDPVPRIAPELTDYSVPPVAAPGEAASAGRTRLLLVFGSVLLLAAATAAALLFAGDRLPAPLARVFAPAALATLLREYALAVAALLVALLCWVLRRYRTTWIVSAAVLALLLGGQLVFAYRTQVAALYPASRPPLEQLCRMARCEVGLPKAADQLVIESSDLQAVDVTKPNLIQLAASVRNRASIEVAFPSIEVTLTDAQDRPLARRVLLPDQYLAERDPARAGLRGGEEFSIRLTLDTTELRPVGYRLYLFYP